LVIASKQDGGWEGLVVVVGIPPLSANDKGTLAPIALYHTSSNINQFHAPLKHAKFTASSMITNVIAGKLHVLQYTLAR
jgi:hypothetical protein